jgi:hypothetical protein
MRRCESNRSDIGTLSHAQQQRKAAGLVREERETKAAKSRKWSR